MALRNNDDDDNLGPLISSEEELPETVAERRLLSVGGTTGIGAGLASDDDAELVPIIDLSQPVDVVEEQLWEAANHVGFFTVINHGIPQDVIDCMFDQSMQFFDQPLDAKKEQCPFDRALNSGFEHKEQIRPSCGLPDQKESLHVSPRKGAMDSRWPTTPDTFQDAALRMIPVAHQLSMRIMSMLERRGCKHLKPGTLEAAHSLWKDDSRSCLRVLNYPAMSIDELADYTRPGNRHWRAAPHTDFSCLSLLFQRVGEEGLECRANPRSAVGGPDGDAKWIPVKPVEGGIAVNIGDMLSHWSDGNLFANLHRVRMPRDDEECSKSRYSIGYFTQADSSYIIESKNGDTITSEEYIKKRLKATFN